MQLFFFPLLPFSDGETGTQRRAGPHCRSSHFHALGTCSQSGAPSAAFSWSGPPIGQPYVQLSSQPGHGLRTWPATSAGPLFLPELPAFPAPASPPGSQFAPPPCRLPHDVPPRLCSRSSPSHLSAFAAQSESQPVLQWPAQPFFSELREDALSAEPHCGVTPNRPGNSLLIQLLLTVCPFILTHQPHCWIPSEPSAYAVPLIPTPPHTRRLPLLSES